MRTILPSLIQGWALSHFGPVIALLVLATAAVAAEPLKRLKSQEVTAKISGMELTDEVHWTYVFEKDGRLRTTSMGAARTGTWRIRNDELCLDGGPDRSRCFEVWAAGSRVELRREGVLPDEGILRKPQALR